METIIVKPWGAGQGDHVIINAADFDPAVHEMLQPESVPAETAKVEQDDAVTGVHEVAQAAAPTTPTRKRRASAAQADETTEG